MKHFDPLLLNGFGTQKERITHRYIFIILNYAPLVLGILGLTHSFKYPFSLIFFDTFKYWFCTILCNFIICKYTFISKWTHSSKSR